MDELTAWIATHTPAYYGPALVAFGVVYKFTHDFGFAPARNLLRGVAFALLIGSKFVVTPDGVSPVPLWQHALTGSAGFALVALAFWTVGGYGVSQLLDAIVETLKAASKALRNSVVGAALLMFFGAIGALAAGPLGAMIDQRFAPPPLALPAEVVPGVVEAIAPAAATPATPATTSTAPATTSTAPATAPSTAALPAAATPPQH